MKSVADLLIARAPQKRTSERNELIAYFHERARDRQGKPYKLGYILVRLKGLKLPDLYYMKSVLEDGVRTRPGFNWNKTFFGMLKPQVGITAPLDSQVRVQ